MLALPLLYALVEWGSLLWRVNLSAEACIVDLESSIPKMDFFKDISFKLSLTKPVEKHFDLFYLQSSFPS